MLKKMFMVVVLSFLLFCAGMGAMALVYLWIRWFVLFDERNNQAQRLSRGNDKPQKLQGLSAAELQRVPIIEYGNAEKEEERSSGSEGGSNADCAVCLEVFQTGDRCRVIPACSHAFHVECADAWLSKRSVCPICRTSAACESKERNGVNDGAAVAAENIVVDMQIP